jgi:HSP20 family protein
MMTYYWRTPARIRRTNAAWGYTGGSRMPVDIREDEEGYRITAAVPGLKAEDVEIQVLEDVVTLRVKAEADDEERPEYLLREIREGNVERSFRLPAPIDPASAEATVENGMLHLHLPKAEVVRPKMISVKSK